MGIVATRNSTGLTEGRLIEVAVTADNSGTIS